MEDLLVRIRGVIREKGHAFVVGFATAGFLALVIVESKLAWPKVHVLFYTGMLVLMFLPSKTPPRPVTAPPVVTEDILRRGRAFRYFLVVLAVILAIHIIGSRVLNLWGP